MQKYPKLIALEVLAHSQFATTTPGVNMGQLGHLFIPTVSGWDEPFTHWNQSPLPATELESTDSPPTVALTH